MSEPIRLVLADDHPIVLDGLEQIFRLEADCEVVARCRDGEETLQAVRLHRPDVLVLDVRMPGKDGIAVLKALREGELATRVVLLTAVLAEEQLVAALRLGVSGVVLKEMAPQLLIEAVRKVHAGGRWFDKGSVQRALDRLLELDAESHEAAGQRLTPRELEVAHMVAQGLRNRAIAEKLFISEGTVKIHLHNIYEKTGADGRLELAVYVQKKGWV
jgi:two-component system nitrate/nitrite response regulator NarL